LNARWNLPQGGKALVSPTNSVAEIVSEQTNSIFEGAIRRLKAALTHVDFSDGASEIL
jgi:hypothetical protein|tara:strand:- start:383 stop:556 length:174 start_codon:yes stop_codon:yes gene_type:complete